MINIATNCFIQLLSVVHKLSISLNTMNFKPYFNFQFIILVTVLHIAIITYGQDDFEFLLGDIGLPTDYKDREVKVKIGPTGPTGPCGPEDRCISPVRPAPLPYSYDWRHRNVISPVRNQRRCAACYAFAGVGVLEAVIRIKHGESLSLDLAEQQPISCDSNSAGCRGGGMSVFEHWKTNAPHREGCNNYKETDAPCPTCAGVPYRVMNWFTVSPSDQYSIKYNLMNKGPAYMSFDVHTPFFDYWRGKSGEVYKDSTAGLMARGRHACQLIGWDDGKRAWLLQNGWGMSPSGPMNDGTIYMPYDSANILGYGLAFIEVEKLSIVDNDISCWNEHRCCHTWATKFNQCSQNSKWMNDNCLVSCGQCTPTFTYDLSCKDYYKKCPAWAANDQCSLNRDWMNMNCRASCKSCDLFTQSSLDWRCVVGDPVKRKLP